jgi:hypothetical protein
MGSSQRRWIQASIFAGNKSSRVLSSISSALRLVWRLSWMDPFTLRGPMRIVNAIEHWRRLGYARLESRVTERGTI